MIEIERGSANVYADLEIGNAEEMHVKAGLVRATADTIEQTGMTLAHAANILGLSDPELSELLRGLFRDISEETLIENLNRLTQDARDQGDERTSQSAPLTEAGRMLRVRRQRAIDQGMPLQSVDAILAEVREGRVEVGDDQDRH
jgi:predicted XRE-type DNA-binding protein